MNIVFFKSTGHIPGVVLFGVVLDKTCILWEQTCEGTGNCLYFDNQWMAYYIFTLCTSLKIGSAIGAFVASRYQKIVDTQIDGRNHKQNVQSEDQTDDDHEKPDIYHVKQTEKTWTVHPE